MVRSRKSTLTDWTAANNALNLRFGGNKSELAKHVGMSRTTVTNFFNEKPVGQSSFEKICRELRLNWQDVSSFDLAADSSNDPLVDLPKLDETLIEKVRNRCRQKILERYGRMRLLNGKEVGVDQLYVDVYLLEKPEYRHFNTPESLLSNFDIAQDRLALSKRIRRDPGFEIANNHPKLVILGKPGSGKTTFLKHLAVDWCKGTFQPEKIAVLIELRKVQERKGDLVDTISQEIRLEEEKVQARKWNLVDAIAQEVGLESRKEILGLLEQGKFLVLMDGLDEVSTDKLRKTIQDSILKFSNDYSHGNRFILTCRTQIMRAIPKGFTSVEVADFSTEQIRQFVQNWFIASGHSKAGATKYWEAILRATNNQPDFREVTATPVLLSLVCLSFQDSGKIPKNRASLYKKGINWLLNNWNAEKAIEDWEVGTEVYRQLSIEDKEALLIEIAASKFENPKNFVLFEQDELVEKITQKLKLANSQDGIDVLKAIEAQHGLLIERADELWSFSHLTFQEYFESDLNFV